MDQKDEKLEPLGNNIFVLTSKLHKFSTDTLLLADFAKPLKQEKAAEFGTGCGTIPLFWNTKTPPKFTLALEIQKEAFDLAKKSVELNNLNDKIQVVNCDLKNYELKNEKHSFDLVVCNPPYKAVGSGIQNENNFKKLARHEVECSIEDIIKKASEFLRFAGRFCICQRPERLSDIICLMRKYNIEPKKLRFVQARENVAPKLFLLEGKYGRNSGMIVMPTLMLENKSGERSDELNKIYNFYGENKNDR